MSARKRIGVLIAQPNAPYQKNLLYGIIDEAFQYDMDVLVFSSFVKSAEVMYLRGEQTVYEIVNYEKVDAVIFVPDTIQIPGVNEQIIDEIKNKFKGPVLVLDWVSEDFPYIRNDDASDVEKMIDHLIEVHQYQRIVFMTGPIEHPYSTLRLNGYLRSLKNHQIPIDEELIYYGDFWIQKAEDMVEKVLHISPLPQAIACASEEMAISVYTALLKRHIRIPEDIAVIGYDPLGSALHSDYQISMMPRPAKALGVRAVRNIVSRMNHVHISDILEENEIKFEGSCGCHCIASQKPLFWSETEYVTSNDYNEIFSSFYSVYNFMLEDIIEPENLIDSFNRIMYYTEYIRGFSSFHICLNQDWIDRDLDAPDFTEQMLYVMELKGDDYGNSKVSLDRLFERSEMLPELSKHRETPCVYYFTPIHFNGINFGYSVIGYENRSEVYPNCYTQWIRKLNNGLESQRRQCRLQNMYYLMREHAVKDMLTNVYSRNGFNIYGMMLFNEAKKNHQELLVIVGDINDTKYVNDTYGHMEGDAAIKIVADSFSSQLDKSNENGKVFRIGGDEFVLMILGEYTQQQIRSKIQGISDKTTEAVQDQNKPYDLSTSLGVFYGTICEHDEINKIIALADIKMYECKKIHREKFSYNR